MRCPIGIFALSLFAFTGPQILLAQGPLSVSDLRVIRGTPLEEEYRQMLPDYLQRLAAEATSRRLARFNAIQTEAEFKAWQEENRRKFLELIGGLPTERTPLNAQVTGAFAREGYEVRKVTYESLPEYYVTADLYVPTTGNGPYPAVLAPLGHSANGKAYDTYQRLFIGLAKRGYVVLAYDPMGQGERYQYWDFIHHEIFLKGTDYQHAMAGLQEMLIGQNLARYFIWDGIRGLDYLMSLPEVDGSRIGVTGSSGGGTLTTYISMLDPRVTAASIVTYITSIPKKIEARSLDPEADPEQDIPGLLAAGLDHTEFVGMIAPRPVQLGTATRDFFPIEGARKTFGELQTLYGKLGVPDHIRMAEFDHRHMYSQPLREATYEWFDRWLKGRREAATHEPEIVTEKDETLECTPTGQVITSLGGKRLYDFNRALAEGMLHRLAAARQEPEFRSSLATKIRERLGFASLPAQPQVKSMGEAEAGDLEIEKFLVESDPGIMVPTRTVQQKDAKGRGPAVIYLRDRRYEPDTALIASLARQGRMVVVADVRGFGETWSPRSVREVPSNYFLPRDGRDADFAYGANFLERPLLGMRVYDALGVVSYVQSRPDVDPARLTILGTGWASVIALYAAALDSNVSGAVVEGIPNSYAAIATAEIYEQPAFFLLPGVLQDFDLQDVFSALAPRPLLVLNPQDPLTRKMFAAEAQESFAITRAAYSQAKAEQSLTVRVAPLERETRQVLGDWLLAH